MDNEKDFKLFSFDKNKKDDEKDKKFRVRVYWDGGIQEEFIVDNLVHLSDSTLIFLEKEDVDGTIIINTDKTHLIKIMAEE